MARVTLIKDATTTGSGDPVVSGATPMSFQAVVAGTGAVTATVVIEGTNQAPTQSPTYLTIGTITLSGTTTASDGFVAQNPAWNAIRARLSAVSGTGATVNVFAGHL